MRNMTPFTQPHVFHLTFHHEGVDYSVAVQTPDLSANRRSCWGDWGPMYTIFLEKSQGIQLTYTREGAELQSDYVIRPKTVELNSPMFAKQRESSPFLLEFEDEPRGLQFFAHFDGEGRIIKAGAQLVHQRFEVDRLIFPQQFSSQLSA